MALAFANRVRFLTATTGTGTLAVTASIAGYQTPDQAGVPTGSTVGYAIEDGTDFEVGQGVYTTGATPTLTRATIESSSNAGAAITLTGNAVVFFDMTAAIVASLVQPAPYNTNPAMDGTAAAGASALYARGDHVHPTDTSRYAASNPAGYVDTSQAAAAAPVQSVAGRTGVISLGHTDITDWVASVTGFASSTLPLVNGTAAIGVSTNYARADHVHPTDTSRAPAASPTFSGTVNLGTGTLTGAALSNYLASPPGVGIATPGIGSFSNLSASGTVSGAGFGFVTGNIGRNLLHNPLLLFAQRGVGPFTGLSTYTLDRYLIIGVTDAVSITQAVLADADRTAIGDEAAQTCLQNVFTGNSAAGSFHRIEQRIENVRRLAGKTATVSFWAKAASGTPKIGINLAQYFGSGGSPSATVQALATGNAVTLSTTWTRYSSTINLPSIIGKTLGTNSDQSTWLQLFFSSGSTNNAIAGNIGVQSGTIQLWGLQLEVGSAASALEKPDPRYDLANCQRFFQYHISVLCYGSDMPSSGVAATDFSLPVVMRAAPNVTFDTITYAQGSALVLITSQPSHVQFQVSGTVAGSNAQARFNAALSADL